MYSKSRLLCICFFFCYGAVAADKKPDSGTELQILIDVSGSMKHTDPNNLRIPAVKLLVNLLPQGSKAGIWLFAQNITVLAKTGLVNKQWKHRALSKLKKIHSSGLFTNIEKAIEVSTKEWLSSASLQKNAHKKRHLLLLTDGMVDISKDIMQSAESRDRVMIEQIPLLQQAGVKIHTIALSDNADAELMEKLAFDTNGWSETAQTAEQLQKVFFKIFKKAIPQDTVPLKGNRFSIDTSIKEFSVLVFKKKGAVATYLYSPDKVKISKSSKSDQVTWLNEKNYDLVTIKNPKSGEWKIVAEMDPDNQVMIVTDLKFNVDEMPNHISVNESFDVTAFFTDQQQLVSRDDFLRLIEITIEQMDRKGGKSEWKMLPVSGKAGLFRKTMNHSLAKGKYTLRIQADSKTFQRESIQTIEVVDSLILVETDVNHSKGTVTITLVPDINILNTAMMTIQAVVSEAGKVPETIMLESQGQTGKWVVEMAVPTHGDSKIINFSVMANTLQGLSISPSVKPVVLNENLLSKLIVDSVIIKPEEENVLENNDDENVQADVKKEQETEGDEASEGDTSINWIKTLAIVIGLNVVLMIAGFFLFKVIKKKAVEKQAQLLGRLA